MRIAIIGWGSLLWDKNTFFDSKHGEWEEGGPILPLEFSRISRSRGGILTPVIDVMHGTSSPTAYCISNRVDFMDAICDLRQREGCLYRYVGWLKPASLAIHSAHDSISHSIMEWCHTHGIDVAVWAGLQPNFQRTTGERFSISAAMSYLGRLSIETRPELDKYIRNLPRFVTTPLLEHIQNYLHRITM